MPEEQLPPENPSETSAFSWTAAEFTAHPKNTGWYAGLVVAAAILAALIYLISRDIISAVVVILAAIIFGVYGARQPRQLPYRLDASGVTIGDKLYPYEAYKSFSIVPEGDANSISFMPLRRFSPVLTIYYLPKDHDQIVSFLTPRLPYEDSRHDAIDSLLRKIRF